MSAPILIAEAVGKTYRTGADHVDALKAVDLTVPQGEFVAVMGPSGSGKTTLLNCLSGLDDIDSGAVIIDEQRIHELPDNQRTSHRAQTMGFIFQAFNLIPVFTAVENVELPLLLSGQPPGEARKKASETLDRVGLGHRLRHRPTELSAGEQQRVTIARALAGQPRLVWADEPTGNLDTETAAHVMELLHELHRDGLTLILVTHDPGIAQQANRLITMRDGSIESSETLGDLRQIAEPVAEQDGRRPRRRTRQATKTTARRTPSAGSDADGTDPAPRRTARRARTTRRQRDT